jgi:hypothetical protein
MALVSHNYGLIKVINTRAADHDKDKEELLQLAQCKMGDFLIEQTNRLHPI